MNERKTVTDEAVEAAKKIAYERYGSKPDSTYLRTILEAAAPHVIANALEEAADAAEGMHDPVAPDCKEWADWLRARATRAPNSNRSQS